MRPAGFLYMLKNLNKNKFFRMYMRFGGIFNCHSKKERKKCFLSFKNKINVTFTLRAEFIAIALKLSDLCHVNQTAISLVLHFSQKLNELFWSVSRFLGLNATSKLCLFSRTRSTRGNRPFRPGPARVRHTHYSKYPAQKYFNR